MMLISNLHMSAVLELWYNEQMRGTLHSKEDVMQALDWTYMARRMSSNPLYYDAAPDALGERLSRLIDTLDAQHL